MIVWWTVEYSGLTDSLRSRTTQENSRKIDILDLFDENTSAFQSTSLFPALLIAFHVQTQLILVACTRASCFLPFLDAGLRLRVAVPAVSDGA